ILVIDETSKDDRTIYPHYGRSVLGERATIAANFVRGERWSMVAALGVEGYSAVRVVLGSVDGDEFFDFINQQLVTQLPTINPFPSDCSILVMDNCAIHKSNALREVV
ncbi:hypothetical protein K435DRAFT_593326, partial [Dendrothele bispora CBS 962.96]